MLPRVLPVPKQPFSTYGALVSRAPERRSISWPGRATGWVAGYSKVGGVIAQGLALLTLVPAFALAAGLIAIPTVASLLLITIFGHETRGRDLRELETTEQLRPVKTASVSVRWDNN